MFFLSAHFTSSDRGRAACAARLRGSFMAEVFSHDPAHVQENVPNLLC